VSTLPDATREGRPRLAAERSAASATAVGRSAGERWPSRAPIIAARRDFLLLADRRAAFLRALESTSSDSAAILTVSTRTLPQRRQYRWRRRAPRTRRRRDLDTRVAIRSSDE
jgi:hypothetical protein